jgi:hypothetical protein
MKEESSEGPLILLAYSSDFDSAIRRFDPSRPSQQQYAEFIAETALFSPISLSAFGNGFRLPFGNSVLLSFSQSIQMELRQR